MRQHGKHIRGFTRWWQVFQCEFAFLCAYICLTELFPVRYSKLLLKMRYVRLRKCMTGGVDVHQLCFSHFSQRDGPNQAEAQASKVRIYFSSASFGFGADTVRPLGHHILFVTCINQSHTSATTSKRAKPKGGMNGPMQPEGTSLAHKYTVQLVRYDASGFPEGIEYAPRIFNDRRHHFCRNGIMEPVDCSENTDRPFYFRRQ
jgi:hypothetical protein